MPDRALSFGAAAQAYERFRPGYPEELADLVLAYAGRPVRTALEIGAGTGKATRLFARRGVAVTATDPDAAMLAELRRHVPDEVRVRQAAFEQLRAGERHDLVYAAAALHWTDPDRRWERIAGLLASGGVFASFGGPLRLADPALRDAVAATRSEFLADDEIPSPDGTPPDVRQSEIARRITMSADDYVGLLSTVSAYLELPPPVREQVFRRVRDVLPGTVEVTSDVTVHLARRTSQP